MFTIRYIISDSDDASKMFIRLTGGDSKADTKNIKNINHTSFSPCQLIICLHYVSSLCVFIICLHYVSSLCEEA